MKRSNLAILAAPALMAAMVLAACSGGGSGATRPAVPAGAAPTSTPVITSSSGARLVLTINRSQKAHSHPIAAVKRHGAAARRSPKFIGYSAQGVQVVVSTTGANPTSQTVYADIGANSTLCVAANASSNGMETCTIPLPYLAASESITATEVDQLPNNEGANSLGNGFPTNSNIEAVGTTTFTATAGTTTNISLGMGPVAAEWYDCGNVTVSGLSADDNQGQDNGQQARIIVTAGAPTTFELQPEFETVNGDYTDVDRTPLPFVDVNGSPAPIAVTGSSTHVGTYPYYNTGFENSTGSLPTPTYSQSSSIPNDGYEWFDCLFIVAAEYDGQTNSPSTITFDQSLSAIPQFTGTFSNGASYESPYGPMIYTVVPISAAPTSATVAVTAGTTANIVGSDYEATNGMTAGPCSGTGSAT
ncbi:MAG: hypothetical protein ABR975_16065, partial [Vulcanimicrobiaceae bacterium]